LSVRPDDDEMDPTVSLLAPDGKVLEMDPADQIPGSHISLRLPADGVYTVRVSSPDTGKYKLRGGLVDEQVPASGEPQDGEIDNAGEVDVYTFHQDGPGNVVVQMRAENDLDGVIELIGPDGELLAIADDTGSGYDPFVGMYLSATGDYRVEASSYDAGTGAYTMRVESSRAPSLDSGKPLDGEINPGERLAYTVAKERDKLIVVRMESAGTPSWPTS
jgi:hypothetical protein